MKYFELKMTVYSLTFGEGKVIKILYQGFKNTTNNRQELKGVLEALKYFKTPQVLEIYSDSSYVVSSINNGHVAR